MFLGLLLLKRLNRRQEYDDDRVHDPHERKIPRQRASRWARRSSRKKTNRRKAQQNELESTESELSDCEQITVQEDSEETDNEEDCSLEQKRRRKSRKPGHA